jgi:hypothetical protein
MLLLVVLVAPTGRFPPVGRHLVVGSPRRSILVAIVVLLLTAAAGAAVVVLFLARHMTLDTHRGAGGGVIRRREYMHG